MFKNIKTAEQLAQEAADNEQRRINQEAIRYLASTDWYITRQQETGKAVPSDITAEREAARARIVDIPDSVE